MIGLNLLTHSRMACYRACNYRHYLAYECGLRPATDSKPLRFGRAFHAGLEAIDKTGDASAACEVVRSLYAECPQQIPLDEWQTECETCVALVWHHDLYYGRADVEVVATELAFTLNLTNPATKSSSTKWKKAGKIDRIVRLQDGRLAVQEYKTATDEIRPSSDYWSRLRIDQQISMYYAAAKALGYDVQTVIYDATRKPTIRRCEATPPENRKYKKDGSLYANQREHDETPDEFIERLHADISERPDWYFQRQEIPRLKDDLTTFEIEVWQTKDQINTARAFGAWPRNTDACTRPDRPCAYKNPCWNGWRPGDSVPDGFEIVNNLHPELESDNDGNVTTETAAENAAACN